MLQNENNSQVRGSLEGAGVALVCEDALAYTKTIPDNTVQLVMSSPPYNIGKKYEVRRKLQAYLEAQSLLLTELARILTDEGSICWEVGNYVEWGEIFPLDIFYYDYFHSLGLKLRNRIIWHYGHGLHASKRFSGRYETILWFTKSDRYYFNLDPVRIPSKYPGKRHFKGPKKGRLSGNPLGKNPEDVWDILWSDWDREIWDVPNVKGSHPEKTEHPCQFPIELAERCILAMTRENDIVYDPYAGVGSTLLAAIKHGRRAVGSDKEQAYVDIARARILALREGKLPMRTMGTPIYRPAKNDKTAIYPKEWESGDANE